MTKSKKTEAPGAVFLALMNNKGGVGKTTTAANIAAYHARQGHFTLAVDLDPQQNLGDSLGVEPGTGGVAQVLAGEELSSLLVQHKTIEGLYIIPSGGPALREVADALRDKDLAKAANILKAALLDLIEITTNGGTPVDLVVLDLPPSFGALTTIGLSIAEKVLVPLEANFLSVAGLQGLMTEMDKIRADTNPSLAMAGVLITKYRKNESQEQFIVAISKAVGKQNIVPHLIPNNQPLADASATGEPAVHWAADSLGAAAYRKVYRHLMETLKGKSHG